MSSTNKNQNGCVVLEKNFVPPTDELFQEIITDSDIIRDAAIAVGSTELPTAINYQDPEIIEVREVIAQERSILTSEDGGLDSEDQKAALESLDRMELDILHGRAATRLMGARHLGGLGCESCVLCTNCPVKEFLGNIKAEGDSAEEQIAESQAPNPMAETGRVVLPMMDSREVAKIFRKAGFESLRTTGSHTIIKNPETGNTFPVPEGHRGDMHPYLLRAIIDQSGLTPNQFLGYR